jgi:hypothetical protein
MAARVFRWLAVAVLLVAPQTGLGAEPLALRVVCWNLESGDSDAALLATQMGNKAEVDVWGLSEVEPGAFDEFEHGAEAGTDAEFETIAGTTGGGDRLAIIYNADRLELVDSFELEPVQLGSPNLRAPLVAHFKGVTSNIEFLFVVNHLLRGNGRSRDEARRLQQARLLNDWSAVQTLPIILLGDLNADFDCASGDTPGGRAPLFDELLKDGHLQWVRPVSLVRTQRSFNSVLDFVLVGNAEALPGWSGVSRILNREDDQVATTLVFNDDRAETDHRPVDAIFTIPLPTPPGPSFRAIQPSTGPARAERSMAPAAGALNTEVLQQILDRLERLEKELDELRDADRDEA